MKLSAVIFDLNGTIVSDENVYGSAFKKVLEGIGAKVKSNHPHESGIGVEENWPTLLKKYGINTDKSVEELSLETQQAYLDNLNKIELKPGFKEFYDSLIDKSYLTAVATSNTWEILDKVLTKFEMNDYFDAVTTAEEVDRNKPDPRIFLIASKKLNVSPEACLVFEDSAAGIKAAKAAGMKAAGVYRDEEHKKELSKADFLINDFKNLSFDKLKSHKG